jgi:hypothetical protein
VLNARRVCRIRAGIIRERVNAGLARARANGIKLGRRRVDPAVEARISACDGDPGAVWSDFEKYRQEEGGERLEDWIKQSDDGPMFVHTLRAVSQFAYRTKLENINLSPPERTNLDHITDLQDLIQRKLNESIDTPRHFQKVQWFAEYWYRSVPDGGKDFTSIQGPGLNETKWLVGADQPFHPLP